MTNETEQATLPHNKYLVSRTMYLKENATFGDLTLKVARLELALMDLLDSTLDAVKYPDMAVLSVPEHLHKLDQNALQLLLDLDDNSDFIALWDYVSKQERKDQ